MSTIVYQNIQSCFDTKSSLSLKLNPPKFPSSDSTTTGWGCIESLSNASITDGEKPEKPEVYVHPLVKRSTNVLSEKSLEMCTENLGSETGTDTTEDDIFSIMSLDSEGEESNDMIARVRVVIKPRQKREITRKKAGYESLPPPLTTMCGANTIRVQPHRDNGRLVMMAVSSPPRSPSMLAERSNGRLTMSLMEEYFSDEEVVEEGNDKEEEEESVEEEDVQEEEVVGVVGVALNDIGASVEEGIDGINKEVGEKFGIGEFQRLRRCKEGGRGSRGLINWETLRVAT